MAGATIAVDNGRRCCTRPKRMLPDHVKGLGSWSSSVRGLAKRAPESTTSSTSSRRQHNFFGKAVRWSGTASRGTVRAQRAVQTMAQIMPRASLLAAVARLCRGVLVVLVAVLRQVLLPTTPFMVSTGTRVMRRPQQLSMLCNMLWLECSDSPSARGAGFVLPHSSWRRGCWGNAAASPTMRGHV